MTGRKVVMLWSGLGTLVTGLALSGWAPHGAVSFPAFATAVSTITAAAILGNVGEHFSGKRGPTP